MSDALLFVYGTLRAGCDDPMARWLRDASRRVGPAQAHGTLYRVADYPGFVPGGANRVAGDLVLLHDPAAAFVILDEHEQCSAAWPEPREYRRARIAVIGPDGPVEAWTYIFAHDAGGLERIEGGDFLA